jgi:hypothetical protein
VTISDRVNTGGSYDGEEIERDIPLLFLEPRPEVPGVLGKMLATLARNRIVAAWAPDRRFTPLTLTTS